MKNQSKLRVIYVESVWDDDTLERHEAITNSPRLSQYEFKFFPASSFVRSFADAKGLFEGLHKIVEEFQPDYIFTHTGMAWDKRPGVFIEVYLKLKSEYPNIKFAIENTLAEAKKLKRHIYYHLIKDWSVFDETDDVIELERILSPLTR